jgi:ATP-binding cassette subfamily B protein
MRLLLKSSNGKLADKLALKFPEGYQQWLGRRFNDGVELSGGEWQKLL